MVVQGHEFAYGRVCVLRSGAAEHLGKRNNLMPKPDVSCPDLVDDERRIGDSLLLWELSAERLLAD